jgi:anti-sigma B factor antagonist
MEASFSVTSRRSKSRCCEVIELAGELDLATAPQLKAVLDEMLVIPDHIIVDVSRLSFIDSTGLELLLRASDLVEGRLWVRGASREISRVLELSGVSGFFCLETDPVLAHRMITRTSNRAGNGKVPPEPHTL